MAEGEFDIHVVGGAETVAKAGEFLLGQERELGEHRQAFANGCQEEEAAMQGAVQEAEEQAGRSGALSSKAEAMRVSELPRALGAADGALGAAKDKVALARQEIAAWQRTLYMASCALEACRSEIENGEIKLKDLQVKRETMDGWKQAMEAGLESSRDFYQTATDPVTRAGYMQSVRYHQEKVRQQAADVRAVDAQIRQGEGALAKLRQVEGKLVEVEAKINTGLEQANRYLAQAEALQKEAEALKGEAERLSQEGWKACNEAEANWKGDCEQLDGIKKTAGESRNELGMQQGGVEMACSGDSEVLEDTAAVLRELANEMQAYEEFTLER